MKPVLGIDTSNYTTSAAVYHIDRGDITNFKRPLPVKNGEIGLRQSDAVFHHTQQLPEILGQAFTAASEYECIGVSARPRDMDGSYMPCFTAGLSAAQILSSALKIPCYTFSHQAGHVAAALFSCGRLDLLKERFLAFHVSGGTTEALLVEPDENSILKTRILSQSMDLKAGQVVDRVGAMLGLSFPAGKELDALACESSEKFKITPTFKGINPCLSGVENQCKRLISEGAPRCDVACYAIRYICTVIDRMTALLLDEYGSIPIVYAGGVMCNSIISKEITQKYGGLFAKPEFSADNAAGIAVLAKQKHA